MLIFLKLVYVNYSCTLCLFLFHLDFAFWKVKSRKIFAIPREEVDRRSGNQPDDEDNTGNNGNQQQQQRHMELLAAISAMELNIQNSFTRKLFSGRLVAPLSAAMKCMYCLGISSAPVIFSTCCRQLIGCSACHAQYNGENCIHCRASDFANNTLPMSMFKMMYYRFCIKGMPTITISWKTSVFHFVSFLMLIYDKNINHMVKIRKKER